MTDEPAGSACDHRWLRLPIADFSVTYQCRDCAIAFRFSWLAAAGGTLDDLDRKFEMRYGGTVTGDFYRSEIYPDTGNTGCYWPIEDAGSAP
jgi:hypothetical protein